MKVENVVIPSGPNGERLLKGSMFASDVANGPGVLYLTGYKSNRQGYSEYAEAVAEATDSVGLTLDISGHGESPGDLLELTERDLIDDVLAGYDALAEHMAVDPARRGISATSYSTHLAAYVTKERAGEDAPKSLLFRAPSIKEPLPDFSQILSANTELESVKNSRINRVAKLLGIGQGSTPSLYDAMQGAVRDQDQRTRLGIYLAREGLLKIIFNYSGTLTVIESEYDELIDHQHIEACLTVAQYGTHRVIHGAGHTLAGAERAIFQDLLIEWADKL